MHEGYLPPPFSQACLQHKQTAKRLHLNIGLTVVKGTFHTWRRKREIKKEQRRTLLTGADLDILIKGGGYADDAIFTTTTGLCILMHLEQTSEWGWFIGISKWKGTAKHKAWLKTKRGPLDQPMRLDPVLQPHWKLWSTSSICSLHVTTLSRSINECLHHRFDPSIFMTHLPT